MDECNQHALYLNHMFIHMCNYSDEVTNEVWIGQPDSQRTVDVEGDSCAITLAVVLSV